ncbi:hypothetical protein AAHZ94_03185 [Streptomyces sp. HSW2009]|uniref:hypothetical protein n=1 Tax=Streptomyces sp. HSW2009 TaxID=3142890 RepID=UPI0032EFD2B0
MSPTRHPPLLSPTTWGNTASRQLRPVVNVQTPPRTGVQATTDGNEAAAHREAYGGPPVVRQRTAAAVCPPQSPHARLRGLVWLYCQDYDVVITRSDLAGAAAVRSMDHQQRGCGPVLFACRRLLWLVPEGTAGRWPVSDWAVCVPARHVQRLWPVSPEHARWVRPPTDHLVDPVALAATVEVAWLGHHANRGTNTVLPEAGGS